MPAVPGFFAPLSVRTISAPSKDICAWRFRVRPRTVNTISMLVWSFASFQVPSRVRSAPISSFFR